MARKMLPRMHGGKRVLHLEARKIWGLWPHPTDGRTTKGVTAKWQRHLSLSCRADLVGEAIAFGSPISSPWASRLRV